MLWRACLLIEKLEIYPFVSLHTGLAPLPPPTLSNQLIDKHNRIIPNSEQQKHTYNNRHDKPDSPAILLLERSPLITEIDALDCNADEHIDCEADVMHSFCVGFEDEGVEG